MGDGRIGFGAGGSDAIFPAGLEDGVADEVIVVERAEEFQADGAGHAVPQRPYAPAGHVDLTHPEEFERLDGPAVQFFEDRPGIGTLDFEPVPFAPALVVQRAHVEVEGDVKPLFPGMIHDPVGIAGLVDDIGFVFLEDEYDRVADHIAIRRAVNELLGEIALPVGHRIDRQVLAQFPGVRTLDIQIGHVERLVEQDRAVAPGLLLVAPVAELRGDGKLVGPGRGVSQHIHRVAYRVNLVFECFNRH